MKSELYNSLSIRNAECGTNAECGFVQNRSLTEAFRPFTFSIPHSHSERRRLPPQGRHSPKTAGIAGFASVSSGRRTCNERQSCTTAECDSGRSEHGRGEREHAAGDGTAG